MKKVNCLMIKIENSKLQNPNIKQISMTQIQNSKKGDRSTFAARVKSILTNSPGFAKRTRTTAVFWSLDIEI